MRRPFSSFGKYSVYSQTTIGTPTIALNQCWETMIEADINITPPKYIGCRTMLKVPMSTRTVVSIVVFPSCGLPFFGKYIPGETMKKKPMGMIAHPIYSGILSPRYGPMKVPYATPTMICAHIRLAIATK